MSDDVIFEMDGKLVVDVLNYMEDHIESGSIIRECSHALFSSFKNSFA